MDGWKTTFLFGMSYFQGQTVSFKEGLNLFSDIRYQLTSYRYFDFGSTVYLNLYADLYL